MSGLPRVTIRGDNKQPKLPSRPDISRPAPDKEPIGGGGELPNRTYLEATLRFRTMKPLGRVKRKGWIQPGKWPTLWLEASNYIANFGTYTPMPLKPKRLQRQAYQCMLHELMHVALWDDTSIAHSKDEDSILHYYVEGDTLTPTEWDLKQMRAAASRIGSIYLNTAEVAEKPNFYLVLLDAVKQWNEWIGRDFFKIKKV